MKRSLHFFAAAICFAVGTDAQVIHIPADLPTIQAGINSASTGDTVLVAEGTYFENINFLGKAITVSSRFILDGDTSHISKTIIDGSQPSNPDTASVVTMWSGEDTTSVLMGFTITGGTGTNYRYLREGVDRIERGGGGILINGSGGLITRNIIEGNHLEKAGGPEILRGGGIFAWIYDNHTVVIRDNNIRNNKAKGTNIVGGGIAVTGGRIICEYNEISNNIADADAWVYGGGMGAYYRDGEGVIREVLVRNNLISGNSALTKILGGGGGGYYQAYGFGEDLSLVYNNVICNNHADYIGGGIFTWDYAQGRIFNNTIVENDADEGKNAAFAIPEKLALYNNIIWSFGNSIIPEFGLYETNASKFRIFSNIIKEPFEPGDGVTAFDNFYLEPVFKNDSFELAENSPGIGWAIDSMKIVNTWYYAPSFDFYGNPRPHPIDGFVDLGALESPYGRTPTGIREHSVLSENNPIFLYPNPFNASFTIETGESGPLSIEIISLNGQLMYSKELAGNIHQLDLSSLQNGIYFITIMSEDFVTTRKIIKLGQ
jgi:hypothetical protein